MLSHNATRTHIIYVYKHIHYIHRYIYACTQKIAIHQLSQNRERQPQVERLWTEIQLFCCPEYAVNTHYIRCIWGWLRVPSQRAPRHFPYRFQVDVLSAKGANRPTWWYTNLSQITRPQNGPLFPFSFSNPDKRLSHTIYDPGLVFSSWEGWFVTGFLAKTHEHLVDWFRTHFLPNWLGWLEAWFSPIHLRWGYARCISHFLHLGIQPQEEKPAFSVLLVGFPHELLGNFYLKNWKGPRRRHRDSKVCQNFIPWRSLIFVSPGFGVSIPKRCFFADVNMASSL